VVIGVRLLNRSRRRVRAPESQPSMRVLYATPYMHTLACERPDSPRRAKPAGAAYLQLFVVLGEVPAQSMAGARFCGAFTRSRIQVEFGTADEGKVATYYGRWGTRRGEFGPWSSGVSMRVAA
jgi:hypothetical protein